MHYETVGKMDVTGSIGQAIDQSKRLLFQGGGFVRWIKFGFIAFLAGLANGGGGSGGGGGDSSDGTPSASSIDTLVLQTRDWVMDHLLLVVLAGTAGFILINGIALLAAWVGSRGQMMLIQSVVSGDPSIRANWRTSRPLGNSAFKFRAVLWLAFVAIMALSAALSIAAILDLAEGGTSDFLPYLWRALPTLLLLFSIALPLWLIESLLKNFVLPLMYIFNVGCLDGWRQFRTAARGNILRILFLLLFRFIYSVGFMVVAALVGFLTLFLGFLPVIHHTIFAPYYLFDRAYTLYAVQSLGPAYRVFRSPSDTAAPL